MARKTKFIILFPNNLTEHEIKVKLEAQDEISANDWPTKPKGGIILLIVTQKDGKLVGAYEIPGNLGEKDIIPPIQKHFNRFARVFEEKCCRYC